MAKHDAAMEKILLKRRPPNTTATRQKWRGEEMFEHSLDEVLHLLPIRT